MNSIDYPFELAISLQIHSLESVSGLPDTWTHMGSAAPVEISPSGFPEIETSLV